MPLKGKQNLYWPCLPRKGSTLGGPQRGPHLWHPVGLQDPSSLLSGTSHSLAARGCSLIATCRENKAVCAGGGASGEGWEAKGWTGEFEGPGMVSLLTPAAPSSPGNTAQGLTQRAGCRKRPVWRISLHR